MNEYLIVKVYPPSTCQFGWSVHQLNSLLELDTIPASAQI